MAPQALSICSIKPCGPPPEAPRSTALAGFTSAAHFVQSKGSHLPSRKPPSKIPFRPSFSLGPPTEATFYSCTLLAWPCGPLLLLLARLETFPTVLHGHSFVPGSMTLAWRRSGVLCNLDSTSNSGKLPAVDCCRKRALAFAVSISLWAPLTNLALTAAYRGPK